MWHFDRLVIFGTVLILFSQIRFTRANEKCSDHPLKGFGFELLMAKLDSLQNQLDGIGHNITMLQNVSARVLDIQSACNTPEKKSVSTEKPSAGQEILPSGALRSCREEPTKRSGKYLLQVSNGTQSFEGVCEQTLSGGGWLVIQHRFDGTLDFYRNWTEYRQGFGDIDREFWIGLERLHQLTSSRSHQLLIEVKTSAGEYGYAQYSAFEIGSESERYSLKQLGTYNGTAGDSLKYHTGKQFTTRDRDNDAYTKNCAVEYGGAWWYNSCHYANLNGMYIRGKVNAKSMCWNSFKGQCEGLASSRMMIREA